MSKLTRAQSKTGKVGDKFKVIEREKDDKPEIDGLRVDRGADTPKKRRKKFKARDYSPKRGKGPNCDSGK